MTTLFSALDWRTMSQQERDLGLNNGVAVPESSPWSPAGNSARARCASATPTIRPPLRPPRRNRIDFLKAGDKAPTLLFIHGGYWQARAKEVFTVMAEGPMAHGINVALIGYTLAPDATLDEIVAEIHAGIDFSPGNCPRSAPRPTASWCPAGPPAAISPRWRCRIPRLGGGWRYQASTTSSRSGTAISTRNCADGPMMHRNSPMMMAGGVSKPLSLVVGSAELPLLRKQTADLPVTAPDMDCR